MPLLAPRAKHPTDWSDRELLRFVLRNDQRGWVELVRRFKPLIYRCITKVTLKYSPQLGGADLDEIYADVMMQLVRDDMRKLRMYNPARGTKLGSWIGMISVNAAYDYLRTLKREPHKACITEAMELVCDLPDPFELTSEHERATIAQKTLEDFSEKDRTFAALYFGEGMDPQTIADKMNISVKTVYSKKHKIQSRLESVLTMRVPTAAAGRRIAA